MINNNLEGNKMTELKARIETTKVHLIVARLHNNGARIAQLEDELEVLTNTTIITELDNIWSK
tara:strand:- start:197 stop:385 length:189 start_codon:yes stop_codon:yes gene_type:complete